MKRHLLRIPRPRATPERKAQLLDQFQRRAGTVAEFAARHGISPATLFRWLRQRRLDSDPRIGRTRPSEVPFHAVSLAQLVSPSGPWAGEVQMPDGTQVRWGACPTPDVLLQVLTSLRRPC